MKLCRNICLIPLWLFSLLLFSYSATADESTEIGIYAAKAGRIDKLHVTIGKTVAAKAVLLEMDSSVEKQQLQLAKLLLQQNEMAMAEANLELERVTDLYERTLISDHDLALGKLAHKQAEARLQQTKLDLAIAERALEQCYIRAPYKLSVLHFPFSVGTYLNSEILAKPVAIITKAQ